MINSVWTSQVQDVIDQAKSAAIKGSTQSISLKEGKKVDISQPFPSPEDWRDGWIYFLMVDRFCNPKEAPHTKPWDSEADTFQGGNLKGVQAQLAYLEKAGAKAIWLSPILKNCTYDKFTYHGYGIQDFLNIDPRYGTEQDLKDVVNEAHARGMYVIMDIVLNHTGDVFAYKVYHSPASLENSADWSDREYSIAWRDEKGRPHMDWEEPPKNASADAVVWPKELLDDRCFRRQGKGGELGGDFESLKELVTEFAEVDPQRGYYHPVRDVLIRAYQYWIAKADIDGFRIDTLKYIEPEFARIFGNSMREFACSIGKKNFFSFGEIYDNEEKIAQFIGRGTSDPDQLVGVDAALDFPLFFILPNMIKGIAAPSDVVGMFRHRVDVEKNILSSHGDAGRYFVTFLDNHDQHSRFYYQENGKYDAQLTMGIACLLSLQGVPCLYYGTEQGLSGRGNSDKCVREALWGKKDAFNQNNPFYKTLSALSELRDSQPSLRYGRQYFRPISGNGQDFGISQWPQGVLAYSRILNDTETLIVMNTSTTNSWQGDVIVDYALNPPDKKCKTLFSNMGNSSTIKPKERTGDLHIQEANGQISNGPVRTLAVSLKPMEIQIIGGM